MQSGSKSTDQWDQPSGLFGYLLTSLLLLQWNEFYKQTAKQGIGKRKKWIDRQDLTSFVGRTSPKMLFTPGMFVANGVINFYG